MTTCVPIKLGGVRTHRLVMRVMCWQPGKTGVFLKKNKETWLSESMLRIASAKLAPIQWLRAKSSKLESLRSTTKSTREFTLRPSKRLSRIGPGKYKYPNVGIPWISIIACNKTSDQGTKSRLLIKKQKNKDEHKRISGQGASKKYYVQRGDGKSRLWCEWRLAVPRCRKVFSLYGLVVATMLSSEEVSRLF